MYDNQQLADRYTLAKLLGYQGNVDDFKKEYDQYYNEFVSSLEPGRGADIVNPQI